jgi:hypothetical protein
MSPQEKTKKSKGADLKEPEIFHAGILLLDSLLLIGCQREKSTRS